MKSYGCLEKVKPQVCPFCDKHILQKPSPKSDIVYALSCDCGSTEITHEQAQKDQFGGISGHCTFDAIRQQEEGI